MRQRSGYSNLYSEEYYRCWNCEEKYSDEDARTTRKKLEDNNWKCLNCNEDHVRVYVVDGTRRPPVFVRKLPNEIKKNYDEVYIRATGRSHNVLNNTWEENENIYRIALKEYRTIKINEGDWLNCVIGGWSGDKDKIDKQSLKDTRY